MVRHKAEEAYDLIAQEYAIKRCLHGSSNSESGFWDISRQDRVFSMSAVVLVAIWLGWRRRRFRTTGIDLSSGMLAQARKLARDEVRQMDMCHLTFPDASFEGVWCSSALLHVPQALAPDALGQMRRVLVPEGMLFLSLLEGESEMWETEASEFTHVQRLFVHYPQPVVTTYL
jgi:SAM-dependent methyltransferase